MSTPPQEQRTQEAAPGSYVHSSPLELSASEQLERHRDDRQWDGPVVVPCECSNPYCVEEIDLSVVQYRALLDRAMCWVLKPGHARPEIERIVETHSTYLLTETR